MDTRPNWPRVPGGQRVGLQGQGSGRTSGGRLRDLRRSKGRVKGPRGSIAGLQGLRG